MGSSNDQEEVKMHFKRGYEKLPKLKYKVIFKKGEKKSVGKTQTEPPRIVGLYQKLPAMQWKSHKKRE